MFNPLYFLLKVMIEDKDKIHKIINKDTQLLIYAANWGHHLIQTLNNYSNSQLFLMETVSTPTQESLLSLLKMESIASFPVATVAHQQAKTAFLNGQKYMFKRINNEYSRLSEVNMKSVVGVGINGNFSPESVDCFLEIREFNRKGKYHISIAKNIFQQKKDFKTFCDEIFSEIAFSLIVNQLDEESKPLSNSYPSFVSLEHSSQFVDIADNESILLPSMFINPPLRDVCIFSGSFNPYHDGHHQMYNLSTTHPFNQNAPVIFEITTKNAEKQQNTQVYDRIKSIISYFNPEAINEGKLENPEELLEVIEKSMTESNIQILISNKGRFIEKGLTKGCFVIGGDTYIRLFDLKFYNNDPKELKKTVAKFIVDDVKFLVFNRKNPLTNQFEPIVDYGVDFEVFEGWSNDISSTKIRNTTKLYF